ncbi:hypothetical protein QBE53_06020 [Vallitaleaceae bacterium 9-2]
MNNLTTKGKFLSNAELNHLEKLAEIGEATQMAFEQNMKMVPDVIGDGEVEIETADELLVWSKSLD